MGPPCVGLVYQATGLRSGELEVQVNILTLSHVPESIPKQCLQYDRVPTVL